MKLPVVEEQKEERTEEIKPRQPMQENKKLTINDFDLLKTIGQGSFGKVLQVCFRQDLVIVRFV